MYIFLCFCLIHNSHSAIPQVQWHNYAELNAVDDRDLGTLIVMNSGSVVSLSIDVVADPCPDVAWTFNGTALELNNYYNIIYNNPCTQAGDRNFTWTYTLNVVLTPETSGQYLANFTNIAGISFLPKAYLTIPSMKCFISGQSDFQPSRCIETYTINGSHACTLKCYSLVTCSDWF